MKNTEKYILPETVFMNIFTHLTKLNTYSVPSIVLVIGRSLLHNATKIANKSFSSVQFSCSVVSDSLQPHGLQHAGFPVHHQLSELGQTHVHRVSDAIQPSHPLCPLLLLQVTGCMRESSPLEMEGTNKFFPTPLWILVPE